MKTFLNNSLTSLRVKSDNIRTKSTSKKSKKAENTPAQKHITSSHTIDVRKNPRMHPNQLDLKNIDINTPKAPIVPNEVRAAQINALARGRIGGLQQHVVHTNNPTLFQHHDLSVASMDIAMPVKGIKGLTIEDTHKKTIKNNFDRINSHISDISLLRNKPTIASDSEKAFIEEGYSFDQRSLLINGHHFNFGYKAENTNRIMEMRIKKGQELGLITQQGIDTLQRYIHTKININSPNYMLGNLLPNTPINSVVFNTDRAVLSPNQEKTPLIPEQFIKGNPEKAYTTQKGLENAGIMEGWSSAGSAVVLDRQPVTEHMAVSRFVMANTPANHNLEAKLTQAAKDQAKTDIQEQNIGTVFKTLLDPHHLTNEEKAETSLSGHNYESYAQSNDELFLNNLFSSSGKIWSELKVDGMYNEQTKKFNPEKVQQQIEANRAMSYVFDRSGVEPLRAVSSGGWKNIQTSTTSKDTSDLDTPF